MEVPSLRVASRSNSMAMLRFICPTTGHQVDTDLDLDAQSFAGLPRENTRLVCPYCSEPHLLAGVQAWLGEIEPEIE